jgi:hypothetical protein
MIVKKGAPTAISREKMLLVEGETPSHLFEALATELGLNDSIEIRSYGGVTDLGKYLKTLVVTPGFKENVKSLGIARDAETDPAKAKQSVQTAIANAHLSNDVSVAIAILPDELSAGNVESLCLRSVEKEEVYECVTQFFACVKEKNIMLPDGPALHKHYAQVYMASKDNPQMFPGMAAYKKVWPLMSETFETLRNFLTGL